MKFLSLEKYVNISLITINTLKYITIIVTIVIVIIIVIIIIIIIIIYYHCCYYNFIYLMMHSTHFSNR